MKQDNGAGTDEAPKPALLPGDWAVFCTRSYGAYMSHETGVIDAVKPKTIMAKVGYGRRLRRFDIGNVIPANSEQDARRICTQLESAKAEAVRRTREAEGSYKQKLGQVYTKAVRDQASPSPTSSGEQSS